MSPAAPKTDWELALNHKYRLPNGDVAINVTALSGLLDDGKSGGMAGSAAKITRAGGDYRAEWKGKADRGTRVHGHCESFLRGEAIECLPEDMGFVDAVEKFIVDKMPTTIELEGIALSALGYGGRFDIIAVIDGVVTLIDLKTGKRHPVEHTLQLAAYRFADGIATYDETGTLQSLRPLPTIERTACLYVAENGTYELVEYPADETAFAQFTALLAVYQWTRTDDIKALVKTAKEAS